MTSAGPGKGKGKDKGIRPRRDRGFGSRLRARARVKSQPAAHLVREPAEHPLEQRPLGQRDAGTDSCPASSASDGRILEEGIGPVRIAGL